MTVLLEEGEKALTQLGAGVLECHGTVILCAVGIDDDVGVALPAATDGGKWTPRAFSRLPQGPSPTNRR